MESNQSYNAAQRTDSDQTLTTSTTGTTPPPIRPVPIENPSAPRPVDPGVRDYVMSRFIAAHCFFDHTLDETIGIVGGIDERHRCASFTVREKIQQLRELMLARSLISDTDNTFAQLLDEF